MSVTYERRKAAGQCPACNGPTIAPFLHCPSCRKVARLRDAQYRQAAQVAHLQQRFGLTYADAVALAQRLSTARTLPLTAPKTPDVYDDYAGPALCCCGMWQPITILPHTCRRCGQRYFVEPPTLLVEEPADATDVVPS